MFWCSGDFGPLIHYGSDDAFEKTFRFKNVLTCFFLLPLLVTFLYRNLVAYIYSLHHVHSLGDAFQAMTLLFFHSDHGPGGFITSHLLYAPWNYVNLRARQGLKRFQDSSLWLVDQSSLHLML